LGYYSSASGENSNVIGELIYGGALEKAGAKPGDKIVKLNDVEVESIDEIKNFLQENKNQPVKVTVLRDGNEIVLMLYRNLWRIILLEYPSPGQRVAIF